jgi:AraC family transcriptional regulator, regulatory protein of adaptative response / DNA-3-methyladenine glycosylase II
MTLDPTSCYRALASHDPRFDGVFFVGVTTTGIYCRPVCRARLPRAERCRFFPSAAAAEAEGFRPCLRCRPEKAPGRAIVDASGRLARSAAARIGAGAMNGGGNLETLAASLHTSSRQLRRAVKRDYGASPVELSQTHRLLLAKRLLTESDLPMTEVAFASGFSSVRRFNALFRTRYRMSPTRLRRHRASGETQTRESFTLALDYRPPLAWEAMLGFLAARAIPGVEVVMGGRYIRTIAEGEHRGWVAVGPRRGSANALEVEMSLSLLPALMPILSRLRDLFDLDAEPAMIDAHLGPDPVLGPLVRRHPGLRVPGAVDGFELALRGIIGQQVSVRGATTLVGRVAEWFSDPADVGLPGIRRYPPTPERLAGATPEKVALLGLPRARAECIVRLARSVVDGELALHPGEDVDRTVAALQELPGIGPWTAQYIAMRGLHWPDAFPHSDLGIRKAFGSVTPAQLLRAAEHWRPWRAYGAIHLWQSLADAAADATPIEEVA